VLEANLLVALYLFKSNCDQNADNRALIKNCVVLWQQIEFAGHMTWPDSLFTKTVSLNIQGVRLYTSQLQP